MRTIPLTRGYVAVVDDEDFEELVRFNWFASSPQDTEGKRVYAFRGIGGRADRCNVLMHRQILGLTPGDGKSIDHIDQDGLNNTRSNLRICSIWENTGNYPGRKSVEGKPCSSQYRGVSWNKRRGDWSAQIKVNGVKRHIGYFDSEEEAARCRDQVARSVWGEFAHLNFPNQLTEERDR